MMRLTRTCVALLLGLALALASQPMAAARVAAPAVGLIELCTPDGPLRVAVDAGGRPVGRAHPCPDCLVPMVLPSPAAAPVPPVAAWVAAIVVPDVSQHRPFGRPVARARAPPGIA